MYEKEVTKTEINTKRNLSLMLIVSQSPLSSQPQNSQGFWRYAILFIIGWLNTCGVNDLDNKISSPESPIQLKMIEIPLT